MNHKGRIAIVSSGNAEVDQREIAAAELHADRIDANICPNGCGPMVLEDLHNRICPICSFHLWCNTPAETGAA